MSTFRLSILSPRGVAFEGAAGSLAASGAAGGFGVLARHAPMIAAVHPGVTKVVAQGSESIFYTGEGVVEVKRDEVLVLVDEAEAVGKIEEAKQLLQERDRRVAARRAAGKIWSTAT